MRLQKKKYEKINLSESQTPDGYRPQQKNAWIESQECA